MSSAQRESVSRSEHSCVVVNASDLQSDNPNSIPGCLRDNQSIRPSRVNIFIAVSIRWVNVVGYAKLKHATVR